MLVSQEVPHHEAKDTIFQYFHSKGMVHHKRRTTRTPRELILYNGTVIPWRAVIEAFQTDKTINRAGMNPAKEGWVWFNFWWARASYLQRLVEPIRTTRRFYYEDWLARLYDVDTENHREHGRFDSCSTCLSTSDPWGPGVTFGIGFEGE